MAGCPVPTSCGEWQDVRLAVEAEQSSAILSCLARLLPQAQHAGEPGLETTLALPLPPLAALTLWRVSVLPGNQSQKSPRCSQERFSSNIDNESLWKFMSMVAAIWREEGRGGGSEIPVPCPPALALPQAHTAALPESGLSTLEAQRASTAQTRKAGPKFLPSGSLLAPRHLPGPQGPLSQLPKGWISSQRCPAETPPPRHTLPGAPAPAPASGPALSAGPAWTGAGSSGPEGERRRRLRQLPVAAAAAVPRRCCCCCSWRRASSWAGRACSQRILILPAPRQGGAPCQCAWGWV